MVVCACASVGGHKGRPYRAECLLANGYPYSLLVFGGIRRGGPCGRPQTPGARSAFGPTSGRCPAESSPARRSANTPAYPPRTPHGAPAPRGPRFPFYLPGRSESAPASRFWRSQNARTRRGRGGEFGPTSGRCPAESSPARRSANTPAYPPRTPHGAPAPRGPRFPFYLPGRSESAPASRFWRSQNARTRRGRGGEFGPTSGRCPAEWSPVRRSASTPACRRRTRRAPPGSPARRTRP